MREKKSVIALLIAGLLVVGVTSLTEAELNSFYHSVQITDNGDNTYTFNSTGMPEHEIDNNVNPNAATEQNYEIQISSTPTTGGKYCTSLGPIGFALNGVPIFNALTGEDTDAVLNEIFDNCKGHSSPNGAYHYHQFTECVGDMTVADQFLGIAMDGHPIYGPKASDKTELLTSTDLDECHGRTVNGAYRYHITADFPYALGCYVSEPASYGAGGGDGRPPPRPGRKRRQTDTVTCLNTFGGAQLCDCTTGSTYQACDVTVAGGDCDNNEETNDEQNEEDEDGNFSSRALSSGIVLTVGLILALL